MLEVGNYVKQASLQFSPRLFRLVKKVLEEKNGVGFLNSQALGAKEEELKKIMWGGGGKEHSCTITD